MHVLLWRTSGLLTFSASANAFGGGVGPTAAVAGRRSLAIVWNATVYHGDILQPLWPQLLSAPPPQLVLPRDCPGVRLGQCV